MTDGRTLDILVVEDNADARATLQMLLELEGHRVRTAESGAQGVERSTAPLDAALIDIGLPDCDGYDVARRIRSTPHGKTSYRVALTGDEQLDDRRDAVAAGFDKHLIKPVHPDAPVKIPARRSQRRLFFSEYP